MQLSKLGINKGLNFETILIVTYGRSGSTLLQGLLNSINGCIIRGENDFFHYGLYQSYKSLINSINSGSGKHSNQAWFRSRSFTEDVLIREFRKLSKYLITGQKFGFFGYKCYGFKEIRYIRINGESEFFDYINFLTQIFPNSAIIFNIRNHEAVMKSGWWKSTNGKEIKKRLLSLEEKFVKYLNKNSNTSFMISYEDVVGKTEKLRQLYEFLGAEYDEKIINKVLSTPHSYKPTQKSIIDLFENH